MMRMRAPRILVTTLLAPLFLLGCATTTPAPQRQGPAGGGTTEPGSEASPPRADDRARPPDAAPGKRAAAPPPGTSATAAPDDSSYLPPSCKQRGGGLAGVMAIVWPQSHAHLRRFRLTRDLDKVKSSKATPVELCGAREQVEWLLRSRCPDGSAPYSHPMVAYRSRVGSLGAGGRCGSVIDLYRVRCPKQTFDVYMSLYHCLPGQSPFGQ